jgi:hypothetical protein
VTLQGIEPVAAEILRMARSSRSTGSSAAGSFSSRLSGTIDGSDGCDRSPTGKIVYRCGDMLIHNPPAAGGREPNNQPPEQAAAISGGTLLGGAIVTETVFGLPGLASSRCSRSPRRTCR